MLGQQLRDARFDATFDTSPGLTSQVQTGQQPLYFNCQGPSGVKGMDPYFLLSIFEAQYYRPTGQPAALSWATSRWRNPEYAAIVENVSPLQVDDPKTLEYFTRAIPPEPRPAKAEAYRTGKSRVATVAIQVDVLLPRPG